MARVLTANPAAAGAAPRARTRTRALDLQPVANDNLAEKQAAAVHALQAFWASNVASNAAASAARKAKADLQKAMDAAQMSSATAMVDLGSKTVTVNAVIEETEAEFIDVVKLKGLVDEATFLKIIKATKTDVVNFVGNNVAVMATSTMKKPADLKVKEVK
jgi:hypothetical protein